MKEAHPILVVSSRCSAVARRSFRNAFSDLSLYMEGTLSDFRVEKKQFTE
jgi:hypothetical protein